RLYRDTEKRQVSREVRLDAISSADPRQVEPSTGDPTPRDVMALAEDAEAIRRGMERLPEDYRRVLVLRYQEGKSYEDIGALLSLTPNAAGKLCMRAVKQLQREVEGEP